MWRWALRKQNKAKYWKPPTETHTDISRWAATWNLWTPARLLSLFLAIIRNHKTCQRRKIWSSTSTILLRNLTLGIYIWTVRARKVHSTQPESIWYKMTDDSRHITKTLEKNSWNVQGPLIPIWINFNLSVDVWLYPLQSVGWITYPFPNSNGASGKVSEWISNFDPHVTGHVITYPSKD